MLTPGIMQKALRIQGPLQNKLLHLFSCFMGGLKQKASIAHYLNRVAMRLLIFFWIKALIQTVTQCTEIQRTLDIS